MYFGAHFLKHIGDAKDTALYLESARKQTFPADRSMTGLQQNLTLSPSIALRFYNVSRHHALGTRTQDETYFGMLNMPYAV
jgi:hypothetical protein